jgi:preprotein translocase subunit SecG
MSLFLFLTVVQGLVAAALVGIVLMQRSEGGGLGIGGGGSPAD